MNPDSPQNPQEKLEASLTSLLLGELQQDQAAELRKKLAQDPELSKLYERLKETIGVVRETMHSPAGSTADSAAPLKLSNERREKLFAHFKTVAPKEFSEPKPKSRVQRHELAIAAALIALIGVGAFYVFNQSQFAFRSEHGNVATQTDMDTAKYAANMALQRALINLATNVYGRPTDDDQHSGSTITYSLSAAGHYDGPSPSAANTITVNSSAPAAGFLDQAAGKSVPATVALQETRQGNMVTLGASATPSRPLIELPRGGQPGATLYSSVPEGTRQGLTLKGTTVHGGTPWKSHYDDDTVSYGEGREAQVAGSAGVSSTKTTIADHTPSAPATGPDGKPLPATIALPAIGERAIALGKNTREDGRGLTAGAPLFGASQPTKGELVNQDSGVWIEAIRQGDKQEAFRRVYGKSSNGQDVASLSPDSASKKSSPFRYYLDLNRNSRFDPNGLSSSDNAVLGGDTIASANEKSKSLEWADGAIMSGTDRRNAGEFAASQPRDLPRGTTSTQDNYTKRTRPANEGSSSNYLVADSEWLGLLQKPEPQKQSGNQFISRYAHLETPPGQDLDVRGKRLFPQREIPSLLGTPTNSENKKQTTDNDLYVRTFRVDPNTFEQGLKSMGGFVFDQPQNAGEKVGENVGGGIAGAIISSAPGGIIGGNPNSSSQLNLPASGLGGGGVAFVTRTNATGQIAESARNYFQALGVDLDPAKNPGKALFYNDRQGTIIVRGTMQDLDMVEAGIQVANVVPPQTTINAKFAEISQSDTTAPNFEWYLGNRLTTNQSTVAAAGGTAPTDTSRSAHPTPLLGDLPAMGSLFRGETEKLGKEVYDEYKSPDAPSAAPSVVNKGVITGTSTAVATTAGTVIAPDGVSFGVQEQRATSDTFALSNPPGQEAFRRRYGMSGTNVATYDQNSFYRLAGGQSAASDSNGAAGGQLNLNYANVDTQGRPIAPNSSDLSLRSEAGRPADQRKPQIAQGPGTMVQDGRLLFELGKYDEAEAKLKDALRADPNDQAALYYLSLSEDAKNTQATKSRAVTAQQNLTEVAQDWANPVKRELLPVPNPYASTDARTKATNDERKGGSTIALPSDQKGVELAQRDVAAKSRVLQSPESELTPGAEKNVVRKGGTKPLEMAYNEAKEHLEEQKRFRQILDMKIASEKIDVDIPKSTMVDIVDKAAPPSKKSSSLWDRIRGDTSHDYHSSARVKIEGDQSDISGFTERNTVKGYDPYFIQTETELIGSDLILGRVVEDLHLNEKWSKRQGGKPLTTGESVQLLKKQLDLRPVGNSSLIEVRAASDNPEEAAKIANAVAESYHIHRLKQREDLTRGGIRALEERFAEQEEKVRNAQTNVDYLRSKLNITDLAAAGDGASALMTAETLRRVENLRIEGKAQLKVQQSLLDEFRKIQRQNGPEALAQAIPTAASDALLASLLEQANLADRRIVSAEKDYGSQNAEVLKLKAQAKDLHQKITNRVDGILLGLEAKLVATEKSLEELEKEVRKATSNDVETAAIDRALEQYGSAANRTVLKPANMPAVSDLEPLPDLPKEDVAPALEAALALNGIVVVNVGTNYVKVVPEGQGGSLGSSEFQSPKTTSKPTEPIPSKSEPAQVTRVLRLKQITSEQASAAAQSVITTSNSILPVAGRKFIVVRDTPENVNRVAAAIAKIDGVNDDVAGKSKPAAPPLVPQPEIQAADNAFSTFSLNVSDVAFKLAAASLEKGQMPDPGTMRSEEFINAFDYRDPEAPPGVAISFASERAQYPFAQNRDLLRFSIKTAALGREPGKPLNLVLLLDNSGSMERADRVRIIHEALRVLAGQLQPQDKLSIVTFARTPHLWVDGIAGNQATQAVEQLSGLTPEGGTNLEEAMNLAYATALRHYAANGINRVVLLTDGAANLGDVEPATLKQMVEANRKQGIALDCFGIGWEGFNDDLLEELSRNGDGRYGFINTPEEAATEFAGQLAGALHVAASDVKVQVEFNPKRVTAWRQIGYAKHQLTKEQFRDNTVDAAEIAASEAGNALYTIDVNPKGEGPIATVHARYKIPGTSDYREYEWPVAYTGNAVPLDQASSAMRLAATASAFSEWLAVSPYAAEVTPDRLLGYLSGVPEQYGADSRPKKLEWMIRQAKSISGK